MKVLYIQHCGHFGGSGRSLFELVTQLMKSGIKAHLICQKGPTAEAFKSAGVQVKTLFGLSQFDNTSAGYYRGIRWLVFLREIVYLIPTIIGMIRAKRSWKDIDIVHVNEYSMISVALAAFLIYRKPIFIHCRLPLRTCDESIRARAIAWIYKCIKAQIIAIDDKVASTIPQTLPTTTVHNSFNKNSILNDSASVSIPAAPADGLNLGFVGFIYTLKGILELVEAIGICKERKINLKLYVAGEVIASEGQNNALKWLIGSFRDSTDVMGDINKIIDKYDIKDRIVFLGYTKNLSAFYRSIDVLCFTSRLNAAGRPVFESAFFGVPSIVAIDRSWADTIDHMKTGMVVPENSPEQIADAIEYLAKNRSELKRMGENAKQMAEGNFSPERNSRQVYSLYSSA